MVSENQADSRQLGRKLELGIKTLELDIPLNQQQKLIAYLELLDKWNSAYNLSGIRDINAMLRLHILDSLSILPFVHGNRVIDIGTGAGLPGIVLAICMPGVKFTLLDSNGKKTRFLFQCVTNLGMQNVEVVNQRVEEYRNAATFDIVISRAFSSLKQFVLWAQHLTGDTGKLLAMKGVVPDQEIKELPAGFIVSQIHSLDVPGEKAQRHLCEIVKSEPAQHEKF